MNESAWAGNRAPYDSALATDGHTMLVLSAVRPQMLGVVLAEQLGDEGGARHVAAKATLGSAERLWEATCSIERAPVAFRDLVWDGATRFVYASLATEDGRILAVNSAKLGFLHACVDVRALVWGGEKRPLVALDAVGEPVGLIAIINPDSYESLRPYSPPGPTP